MDKFLGESHQPNFDAPNPTVLAHQNVNLGEINSELRISENSLEQHKNGETLQGFRKELPYENSAFVTLQS